MVYAASVGGAVYPCGCCYFCCFVLFLYCFVLYLYYFLGVNNDESHFKNPIYERKVYCLSKLDQLDVKYCLLNIKKTLLVLHNNLN